MNHPAVRDYYARFGEREWTRLLRPADGAIEFAVNRAAIEAHLPVGARVLDIGGGPGRYTVWLAERGHRVVLADLSPELLTIARLEIVSAGVAARVEAVVEADACDLRDWPDGAFGAALCLGPFYHLPEARDRDRAASELARVLAPGGVAFVALMPRYALLRRVLLLPAERHLLAQPGFLEQLLDAGAFVNDGPGRFAGGYGARPEEIAPFFEAHGFRTRTLLSSEGVSVGIQEALGQLASVDPDTYARAIDVIVRTASDPSVLGLAGHLLYIGQRAA